jgi:hypothetical protein
MNRVVIQEGYSVPSFDGAKRGKRKGKKSFGAKMRACGKSWRSGRSKSRTWKSHLRKCLAK